MKWLSSYAPLPEFQISERTFYILPVKMCSLNWSSGAYPLSQGQWRMSFSVNKWFYTPTTLGFGTPLVAVASGFNAEI